MSWQRSPESGALTVWFNRDESRLRPEASPPRIRHGNDGPLSWIAGLDPEGGGTWMAVNEYEVCLALLNFYDGTVKAPARGSTFTSRGLLVAHGASNLTSIRDTEFWLRNRVGSHAFRPFLLAALDSGTQRLWKWDSGRLTQVEPELPISTSSHATSEVLSLRRKAYRETGGGENFHRWRDPDRPESSALMARDDARTVSLSRVEIFPGENVQYRYATGPDWEWSETVRLPSRKKAP